MRAAYLAVLFLLACGGEDERLPPAASTAAAGGQGGASASGGAGGEDTSCAEGETRTCKVVIGEHNGVQTCFVGVELCIDGAWGPCVEAD